MNPNENALPSTSSQKTSACLILLRAGVKIPAALKQEALEQANWPSTRGEPLQAQAEMLPLPSERTSPSSLGLAPADEQQGPGTPLPPPTVAVTVLFGSTWRSFEAVGMGSGHGPVTPTEPPPTPTTYPVAGRYFHARGTDRTKKRGERSFFVQSKFFSV
jgi:hypothetical protein